MAIYRQVRQSFWTDTKVVDDFTPEDRYFYLYLMTNPHTNLCGCYELSFKSAADETGYSRETVERLICRLTDVHNVIRYSKETKELLIVKWGEYNWTSSPKFCKPLKEEIESVKNAEFKAFLSEMYNRIDTVSIPYEYGSDTTVSVSVSDTDSVTDKYSEEIKNIVGYLNDQTGKRFSYKTKETQKHIRARLEDGYTVEDFKRVIDNKCADWLRDPKMCDYLRPQTLFVPGHFESYLNQTPKQDDGGVKCLI